jgi:hypothetical protein
LNLAGFGTAGKIPIPGDYGDGKADLSVWRPYSHAILNIQQSTDGGTAISLGLNGEGPAAEETSGSLRFGWFI